MAKTDDDFSLVVGDDGLARPAWAATDPLLREYYDTEWGMPVRDERGVFERLSLEVFQAGLSWGTMLRKREAFRAAFDGFDPDVVAGYGPDDVERLMGDAAIIRNHRKILATITNAQATVALREADDVVGGLAGLFWSFQPDVTPMPRTGAEVPSETAESAALAVHGGDGDRGHAHRGESPARALGAVDANGTTAALEGRLTKGGWST